MPTNRVRPPWNAGNPSDAIASALSLLLEGIDELAALRWQASRIADALERIAAANADADPVDDPPCAECRRPRSAHRILPGHHPYREAF